MNKLTDIPQLDYLQIAKINNVIKFTSFDERCQRMAECETDLYNDVIDIDRPVVISGKDLNTIKKLSALDKFKVVLDDNVLKIKADKKTFKASIIQNIVPITMPSNIEWRELPYGKEVLDRACKYASNNIKKPILTGICVCDSGVVATDSFKMYLKGVQNDFCVTIDKLFIQTIKNDYTSIYVCQSKCKIIDVDGICWYGGLIQGTYPNVNGLIKNIGLIPNININDMQDDMAYCLDTIDSKDKNNSGLDEVVMFNTNEDNDIVISNTKFKATTCVNVGCQMKIAFTYDVIKSLVGVSTKEMYYTTSKSPLTFKTIEDEILLFLPISIPE